MGYIKKNTTDHERAQMSRANAMGTPNDIERHLWWNVGIRWDVYKRQVPAHMLGNVREIEYLKDNRTAAKIDIRFQKYEGRKQKEDSWQKNNGETHW